MNIITGYGAEPHVSSQQDREENIGIYGDGVLIVDSVGAAMAATVVSNNEIQIADGLLVAEGCSASIEKGTSESLSIENGTQGMLRTDLIVARYARDSGTAVETMELAVIKGTPAASNPAEPAYNTGRIDAGDSPVDFPLYRVSLSGISITNVERLAEAKSVPGEFEAVDRKFTEVESKMNEIRQNLGGVKIKAVQRTVTLPNGSNTMTETTVSFENDLPENAKLVGVDITMGYFHLPYSLNGDVVGTWVSRMWPKAIVINNRAGVYQNYNMIALLFYVNTTA